MSETTLDNILQSTLNSIVRNTDDVFSPGLDIDKQKDKFLLSFFYLI